MVKLESSGSLTSHKGLRISDRIRTLRGSSVICTGENSDESTIVDIGKDKRHVVLSTRGCNRIVSIKKMVWMCFPIDTKHIPKNKPPNTPIGMIMSEAMKEKIMANIIMERITVVSKLDGVTFTASGLAKTRGIISEMGEDYFRIDTAKYSFIAASNRLKSFSMSMT